MNSSLLRIRILSGCIIIGALILLSKLYVVQIVYGDYFRDRADRQYVKTGASIFNRGSISFLQKDGSLVGAATLQTGYILAISPKLLDDSEDVYARLSNTYPLNREEFFLKASKKEDPYEELARHLSDGEAQKISDLKIEGVVVTKERWRYYPGGKLASQTLGFVGFKGDVLTGRYGLERYYNDILSRDEGNAYTNFFAKIFSNITEVSKKEFAGEGDIVLTIEPTVQDYLEGILQKTITLYSAVSGGAMIINPKNGEIYALAGYPDFDPNSFQMEKNGAVFSNPLVEGVFEMGSIIKPLTMASGIDSKAVTPTTTYDDQGFLVLDGKKISNYDGKGRGIVSMQEVLSQSLNTGVSFVVAKEGKETFARYFKNFGFGEETGIDLPGEARGLVKNLESTRDIEFATASFGQGIALTPVQTVRALSSLANGGLLVTPHVVKEIRYNLGVSRKLSYGDGKRVLKPQTSETVSRMLTTVVDTALAHGKIKRLHYSVAAKTGTAQIAENGKYDPDRFMHSFFGYFPSYDAKFLVFFYIVNPRGVQFASETLTEPFNETVEFLINYYHVPPDR